MNKAILIEMLGKPFSALIKEYHFPSITSSIIQQRTYSAFAQQLSGLPTNAERLKKKIIHLIQHGRIEEVEQKNSALLIRVRFYHRSELWLVEMTMNGQTWEIGELLYRGQFSRKWFLPAMCGGASVLLLCGGLFWGYSIIKENLITALHTPSESATAYQLEDSVIKNPIDRQEGDNQQSTYKGLESESNNRTFDNQESEENKTGVEEIDNKDVVEQSFTINIRPGMNSQQVASLLVEKGLARSEKEITELFTKLNVQRKIQSGTFTIPHNATYLEIIEMITK